MIEVDCSLALEAMISESLRGKPNRLNGVFLDVARSLPVGKREVRAALQRMRKAKRIKCNMMGVWSAVDVVAG